VAIQAVVFDIGGVLEVTPRTAWRERWAAGLGLTPAAFEDRVNAIFEPGAIGGASLQALERQVADAVRL
jgi:putative hydrolase of the HAD superfamily